MIFFVYYKFNLKFDFELDFELNSIKLIIHF